MLQSTSHRTQKKETRAKQQWRFSVGVERPSIYLSIYASHPSRVFSIGKLMLLPNTQPNNAISRSTLPRAKLEEGAGGEGEKKTQRRAASLYGANNTPPPPPKKKKKNEEREKKKECSSAACGLD